MFSAIFGVRWSEAKFKTNLKLSLKRMSLVKNKGERAILAVEKETAQLLTEGKPDLARIKVENLLHHRDTNEVLEKLSLLAELLHARSALIDHSTDPPSDLASAISSVIYASARLSSIDELRVVAKLLTAKFGKEFSCAAADNVGGVVDPSVVHLLNVCAPDPFIVSAQMRKIAVARGVEWAPDEDDEEARFEEARKGAQAAATAAALEVQVGSPERGDEGDGDGGGSGCGVRGDEEAEEMERLVKAITGPNAGKEKLKGKECKDFGAQACMDDSEMKRDDSKIINNNINNNNNNNNNMAVDVNINGHDVGTSTVSSSNDSIAPPKPSRMSDATAPGYHVIHDVHDPDHPPQQQQQQQEDGAPAPSAPCIEFLHINNNNSDNADISDNADDDDGSNRESTRRSPAGSDISELPEIPEGPPPDYDDLAARFEALKKK